MLCVCEQLFLSLLLAEDVRRSTMMEQQQQQHSLLLFFPLFSVCLPTLSTEKVVSDVGSGGDAEMRNGRGWVEAEASSDQAKSQPRKI
jgi:hypothetical protein